MKIACIGGGPAGLYFGILMKRADPAHEVTVWEQNRADDTFGFGVVFSDATMGNLATADPESHAAIIRSFAHWNDIEIHFAGRVVRSTGHGFAGMGRQQLLTILQGRARELGVVVHYEQAAPPLTKLTESHDLVVAADGVNSAARNELAAHLGPDLDFRPNRFVWLGTTFPFQAFTFYFRENEHGLFRVHAYRYAEGSSTFILECTEDTWKKAGLDQASEADTVAYAEALFSSELRGHRLLANRSIWRAFPTVKNRAWHHENVVLMGDAAHTAHFSIGSGTKLAMEACIALRDAVASHPKLEDALEAYESGHRPGVEGTQRAAQVSLEWFENTERYMKLDPTRFAFSLLTRSLRVTHENLALRDPDFVHEANRLVVSESRAQSGREVREGTPPMFTPYRLRDLVLDNRIVVSPMCQYSADDGVVDDWHLVHLGSRALGGAGLVMTEMTDVSRDGRITPGCAGLYRPEHATAYRRVVDFVHRHSSAKIGVQLAHAGRKGATKLPWEGPDLPLGTGDWPLISASALPYLAESQLPRSMSRADMDAVTADFVRAAELANQADFDLLELHCAHGYLLASFISPLTNRRDDEYGGAIEGRMRYPLEVFDAVRAAWPAHRPMSVRISACDWAPGGVDLPDIVKAATLLKEHGADIIDVSAGQTVSDARPIYGRLFQTPFSERVRLEASVPTMTVGNISSWSDANSIIAAGRADLCVLARAHLYDPYWTRHAANEQGWELEWPSQYASVRRYVPRFR